MPVETEPPLCTLLRQPNLHGIQHPTMTMITRPVCLSVHKRSDVPSRPEPHPCVARCRTKRVTFSSRQWLPETKHSNTDRDEEIIRVDDRGTAMSQKKNTTSSLARLKVSKTISDMTSQGVLILCFCRSSRGFLCLFYFFAFSCVIYCLAMLHCIPSARLTSLVYHTSRPQTRAEERHRRDLHLLLAPGEVNCPASMVCCQTQRR